MGCSSSTQTGLLGLELVPIPLLTAKLALHQPPQRAQLPGDLTCRQQVRGRLLGRAVGPRRVQVRDDGRLSLARDRGERGVIREVAEDAAHPLLRRRARVVGLAHELALGTPHLKPVGVADQLETSPNEQGRARIDERHYSPPPSAASPGVEATPSRNHSTVNRRMNGGIRACMMGSASQNGCPTTLFGGTGRRLE